MREERWAGGGRAKFFFTHKRGASSTFRLRFTLLSRTGVQSPGRFELRKAPKEAVDPGFVSFSPFQEACPDLFLSRALPAAGCDSKLSLGSGMQSSELSRQSLAYPGPTEINLAWSVPRAWSPRRLRGTRMVTLLILHISLCGSGEVVSLFLSCLLTLYIAAMSFEILFPF